MREQGRERDGEKPRKGARLVGGAGAGGGVSLAWVQAAGGVLS